MHEFDVTLVVPTWNIESKLVQGVPAVDATLASIARQVESKFGLEVLFIDDLSTDRTQAILNSWIENNPAITGRVLTLSQKCGGPSGGRNLGIEMARGKYVAFMDCDDELGGAGSLHELFQLAELWNSDILSGRVAGKGFDVAKSMFARGDVPEVRYVDVNPLATIGVWSRLFRVDFVRDSGARFPEEWPTVYEDLYFHAMLLRFSPRHSITARQVYYYWVRTDGEHLSGRAESGRVEQVLRCLENLREADDLLVGIFLERVLDLPGIRAVLAPVKSRENQLVRSRHFSLLKEVLSERSPVTCGSLPVSKQVALRAICDLSYPEAVTAFRAIEWLSEHGRYLVGPRWGRSVRSAQEALCAGIALEYVQENVNVSASLRHGGTIALRVQCFAPDAHVSIAVVARGGSTVVAGAPVSGGSTQLDLVDLISRDCFAADTYDVFLERSQGGVRVGEAIAMEDGWDIDFGERLFRIGGREVRFYRNWKGGLSLTLSGGAES